jgi:tetratricopeptide (TPR) repeat protein
MKYLLTTAVCASLLLGTFRFKRHPVYLPKHEVIGCSPYPDEDEPLMPDANGKFISPLPGWGSYTYSISTHTDSVQFYFDQGLNMYYSYHLKEAIASFKEAARLDPKCLMAYWGQGLAMGPYYNAANTYTVPKAIPEVIAQMNNTASNGSEKERRLAETIDRRYEEGKLNEEVYATSLQKLIALYPDDQDIKTLYIDAVMLMHAWDFWNNDGSPKRWTPELTDLCANVLKINPNHPAALHYYIHLTEASRHPEVAFANADKLKTLMPGVAHMVHMASHEYQRSGTFAQGVEVNDLADQDLHLYDSLAANVGLTKHVPHYFAVQAFCALTGGMYQDAMRSALLCRKSVSPSHEDTYAQYLYMMPTFTLLRLCRWEEILADSHPPDSSWTYAGILYNFARGLAYFYTGHADSASAQLRLIQHKSTDPILAVRNVPFNAALPGARIAEAILNGVILVGQQKIDSGIASLHRAIAIEDKLIYREPTDWIVPARQILGAYFLMMARPALAEQVYREDLIRNPGNGWDLIGLCESLEYQDKTDSIPAYKAAAARSFSRAERMPVASFIDIFSPPSSQN